MSQTTPMTLEVECLGPGKFRARVTGGLVMVIAEGETENQAVRAAFIKAGEDYAQMKGLLVASIVT